MSCDTTLKDLGITRDQSSKWQAIAAIPEDVFEELLESEKYPSTTELATIGRQYQGRGALTTELVECELMARVDEFRQAYRLSSRDAAMRWLLDSALGRAGF